MDLISRKAVSDLLFKLGCDLKPEDQAVIIAALGMIKGLPSVDPAEPCNCPLTWDELKNLEGKPVWLKTSLGCEWVIIYHFVQLDDGSEAITTSSAILEESDCGVKWQAFRNEVQHE